MPFKKRELLAEVEEKIDRLQSFLRNKELSGAILTRVANFAWITGGLGDNEVRWGSEAGEASILVLRNGRVYVIAGHGDVPRIMSATLDELGYEPIGRNWLEDETAAIERLSPGGQLGSDIDRPGFVTVDIAPLRYQLTDTEVRKYRWLGQNAADAVIEVAKQIWPGIMEREVEAMTVEALMHQGLRPVVAMVSSDDILFSRRQALHSETKRVEKYAMVRVCARKWGLVACLTRFIHFGPLSEELKQQHASAAMINAHYWAGLKPGVKICDLFEQAKSWYDECGQADELWRYPQGGACGYAQQDLQVRPDSPETVLNHQAFALTPAVEGAQVEDTVIVFNNGLENVTETGDWPMIPVKIKSITYKSPDVLIVGAPQTAWDTKKMIAN